MKRKRYTEEQIIEALKQHESRAKVQDICRGLGIVMMVPTRRNERWSMDFVHDQLSDSRLFRVLNVVDDFTRECVGQLVETSISGERVARYLSELIAIRGKPRSIVCDNGTEFTCKMMYFWSQEQAVKLDFIQPGKPTQNAFAESFNGKFRDSCLNQHWFTATQCTWLSTAKCFC